ncbi:unnamed protein product [Chironomus riparius]|uniref:Uncharacterized protein n=1 Tax=Chironomus riparius TaxID=315576 RepID=A0A9N9WSG4_9DIPT|nr:unnamed protein product [Chironomus riparius]
MYYKTPEKLLATESTLNGNSKMFLKLSAITILLIFCYTSLSSTHAVVSRVAMPEGCARACPPQRNPSRFICARNSVTGVLGTFEGDCTFGRYNHCVNTRERYSFVRYGNCHSGDF